MNHDTKISFLLFLFLLLALTISQSATAAITVTPSVDGLSGGTFKPLTTPAIAGSNFTATGKVLINGRFVNIPGYIPPASTAANAAKVAVFNNPWILGAMLFGWIGEAGLGSDQVGGWSYTPSQSPQTEPYGPGVTMFYTGALNSNTKLYSVPGGTCANYPGGGWPDWQSCTVINDGATLRLYDGANYTNVQIQNTQSQCKQGYTDNGTTCVLTYPALAEQPQPRPATQADFEALPPPPIAALAELAPQVGVPVDAPTYQPGDYAIGDPYTRADGSTAQPMAKVSPAGNGQVAIDTYDLPLTTPNGDPITNPEPESTADPVQNQCQTHPHSLGCANLDVPAQENLQTENRSIALISPISLGGAGQCPAPLTASFLGQTVEFSFDPLCQFATTLRPLLLALSWLAAGVIFIGGVRNG